MGLRHRCRPPSLKVAHGRWDNGVKWRCTNTKCRQLWVVINGSWHPA